MSPIRDQLWSVIGTVFAIIAVFFFRFYRDTRDRFFVLFGMALSVFSLQYYALAFYEVPDESRHWVYLMRLLAFALIVAAVVDKNRQNG